MKVSTLTIMAVTLFAQLTLANESDQLTQLFSYFQATCPTQGEWTKAALGQTQSLIQTLKSVQKDPDCQTLSGAVGQLDIFSAKVQDLAARTDEKQVIALRRQNQDLLMALGSNPSPSLLPIIQQSLRTNQDSLSFYEGSASANQSLQHVDESAALRNLILSSNILLSQGVANQACLFKNPSILTGFTSVASSVAAGAMTSGASIGVSAAVNLLGSVMEYIRQAKIAKKIDTLSQNIASQAYACVMESMTNQWCSAQDAQTVVQLKAKSLTSQVPNDAISVGNKILDRDLTLVLTWLSAVEAGVEPANQGEGARQNRVLVRRQLVQSARALGLGTIDEKLVLFNQAGSDDLKWIVERSAITDLLTQIGLSQGAIFIPGGSSGVPNPLTDVNSVEYAPYYLLGLSIAEAPKREASIVSFPNFDPFSKDPQLGWPSSQPPFKPDMQIVRTRLLEWILNADSEVKNEFITALQPDPLGIMSDAATLIRNRSPLKSLKRMHGFLTLQASQGGGPTSKMYADTIRRLGNIITEIESVTTPQLNPQTHLAPTSVCDKRPFPDDPNRAAAQALTCIYHEANLDYGTIFVQGRIERAVRIKLNNMLVNGEVKDVQLSAKLLAADDVVKEIQAFTGQSNLTIISRDIEKSQQVVEKNLGDFTQIFGKNMGRIMKSETDAVNSGNYSSVSFRRSIAEMCLMLASVPTWPEQIPKEICLNTQLKSIFAGGPDSLLLSAAQLTKPLSERACGYRDFLRESKIYQDFKTEQNDQGKMKKPRWPGRRDSIPISG